ncbi:MULTISPECIES: hypothetical protein [unclassified Thauera]|mgnify:CR=1 FL=1|uniref:hypothetical protein n=1 Tax=unclassified Thauera TaxID=2609274 RepID=UPI0002CF77AE|nr:MULTISPECIES: hypothetical protein [unclassified Thauera]ENO82464.1 hypothetical protein B447_03843 [Thauera sp. 27]ENO93550.1 hypothetical protein C662_06964 [Thauera sp. 28]HAG76448.1 hypothetical protein [Thauera sp.]HNR60248.1 hypothetical protein [Thauera sp.]HRJ22508.1 hypothetical protein [Thauera sp.]
MPSSQTPLPSDPLAALVDGEAQRRAAHLAQEAFARVFRLSVAEPDDVRRRGVEQLRGELAEWAGQAADDEARALRLALLLAGMDQWGLAWTQAFELVAIPGLTELIGALRTGLDAQAEARFLRHFESIGAAEQNVIDFKVELRRALHLALWHSSIATESREEALRLSSRLGGMLLALAREMPIAGWRLVADAVAFIQIRCLADSLAVEGIGQEATQALFAALARELPKDVSDLVMAHATRAVIAWQHAQRGPEQVH